MKILENRMWTEVSHGSCGFLHKIHTGRVQGEIAILRLFGLHTTRVYSFTKRHGSCLFPEPFLTVFPDLLFTRFWPFSPHPDDPRRLREQFSVEDHQVSVEKSFGNIVCLICKTISHLDFYSRLVIVDLAMLG